MKELDLVVSHRKMKFIWWRFRGVEHSSIPERTRNPAFARSCSENKTRISCLPSLFKYSPNQLRDPCFLIVPARFSSFPPNCFLFSGKNREDYIEPPNPGRGFRSHEFYPLNRCQMILSLLPYIFIRWISVATACFSSVKEVTMPKAECEWSMSYFPILESMVNNRFLWCPL